MSRCLRDHIRLACGWLPFASTACLFLESLGNAILPGFDMLILQSPLFFEYFGIPEAAEMLRRDDSIVREMLFPVELMDMVRRTA